MSSRPRIAVAGTGYVGMSNAVILAQHNTVMALDIDPDKVDMINRRESPIIDEELQPARSSSSSPPRRTTTSRPTTSTPARSSR
jgi:UDP-glucose 6-dehydrogenase